MQDENEKIVTATEGDLSLDVASLARSAENDTPRGRACAEALRAYRQAQSEGDDQLTSMRAARVVLRTALGVA